jgi:MFS family permease
MKSFLWIWLGQSVSALGTSLGSFALGVWVFQRTGSVTGFATIGLVAGIVMFLMAPVGGALADRFDRRKLLLTADLGSGLLTGLVAILLLTDRLALWLVYPFVASMVAFLSIQGPALQASVSLLVPRQQLARAAGMSQTSRSFAQIVGPFAAGFLVGQIGFHGLIFIDTCTFLFAVVTLLLVRIPMPVEAPAETAGPADRPPAGPRRRRSVKADFSEGWRYLRERPGLLALLAMFATTNFCMGMVQVLLTPLILSFATTVELGSVSSAAAAGALLGAIVLSVWGGPQRRIWLVFAAMIFQGCLLFLGGVEPSVPLVALAAFAFMFTVPLVGGTNQAILQSKVAHQVQGRVFGMAGFIAASTLPVAAALAGPLADRVFEPALAPGGALAGTVGPLVGVGPGRGIGFLFVLLGATVVVLVCLAFLNPRLRRLESELPDAQSPAPAPAPAPGMAPAPEGA